MPSEYQTSPIFKWQLCPEYQIVQYSDDSGFWALIIRVPNVRGEITYNTENAYARGLTGEASSIRHHR